MGGKHRKSGCGLTALAMLIGVVGAISVGLSAVFG